MKLGDVKNGGVVVYEDKGFPNNVVRTYLLERHPKLPAITSSDLRTLVPVICHVVTHGDREISCGANQYYIDSRYEVY